MMGNNNLKTDSTIDILIKASKHTMHCKKEISECMICINLMDVGMYIKEIFEKPDEYIGSYSSEGL